MKIRERFVDALPDAALALLKEIEDVLGRQIELHLRPPKQGGANPTSPSCGISETLVSIIIRGEDFSPHGLCHELIHLHRWVVQRIVKFVAFDRETHERWVGTLENEIEQVLMAPHEKTLGFDAVAYVSRTIDMKWMESNPARLPRNPRTDFHCLRALAARDVLSRTVYRRIRRDVLSAGRGGLVDFLDNRLPITEETRVQTIVDILARAGATRSYGGFIMDLKEGLARPVMLPPPVA